MFIDIIENAKEDITIISFIEAISQYNDLDEGLASLDDAYLQFFIENEKTLRKTLDSIRMTESSEDSQYVGWSMKDKKVNKIIKYKSHIIDLEYDPELGTWLARPRFRSVVKALRYGKALIDDI